jgi:competence protein ComEC
VLADTAGVVIFDACLGGTLLDFLEDRGINDVNAVVISHADRDHISGLLSLLLDEQIRVRHIYVNPDSRRTPYWQDTRRAIKIARERGDIEVHTEVHTGISGTFNCGEFDIQILAPEPENVLGGVEGVDLEGRVLHAHTLNAVVRLVRQERPIAFLAGDMDYRAMELLRESGRQATARVLVFPHHGGHSGARNPQEFVRRLCELVQPDLIVFSIERGKHGTPRPEIVHAIRQARPNAHIACTQLSTHCAQEIPPDGPTHLTNRPAHGRSRNSCCAGTIVIDFAEEAEAILPVFNDHTDYIARAAPSALCLGLYRAK